eukprot:2883819-Alexandrium_andersonii.AAC.1
MVAHAHAKSVLSRGYVSSRNTCRCLGECDNVQPCSCSRAKHARGARLHEVRDGTCAMDNGCDEWKKKCLFIVALGLAFSL